MGRKKTSMQKEVEKTESKEIKLEETGSEMEPGDQMTWIDLNPEELKAIMPKIRKYRQIVKQRVTLTAQEVELKEAIKEFFHKSDYQRLSDGSIKVHCEGLRIRIIPQDEKIEIKEDKKAVKKESETE